ncbi:MAG TPA: OmpA family protein [Gammaproteobacteria bacterium]|nr:OmpA family protein [Gammaproteobacteria bacterium]
MKLNKIAKVVLVGCSMLALGACSAKHNPNGSYDTTGMNDMNTAAGAHASGLGQGQGYGDEGGASSARGLAKKTYYFDFNSYVVRDADKPAIMANADYLVAHPRAHIILEGHTDPRGSREYNVALGEHRANAVLEMMKTRGVNPNQVRVVSYGAERPAVPGHSEQDFQLDRRVVIVKS